MIQKTDKIDWFTYQTYTCQNIVGVGSWFFGVLQKHIEHHLWITMPTFNYVKASAITKEFCLEHGVLYKETTPFGVAKEMYYKMKANSGILDVDIKEKQLEKEEEKKQHLAEKKNS